MRLTALCAITVLTALAWSATAGAASSVKLTPASGRPSLVVTVAGTAFGASEAVDVYFDTVDTLLAVTSAGVFNASLTIPAAAQPGTHYVTAIGRKSGDAAQLAFKVTTPWKEQSYGAARLGWNPYENTLNSSNVSSLGLLWSVNVNGAGGTPAVSGGRAYVGTFEGVEARSAATGALLWNKATTDGFDASPAVVGNILYIGSHTSGTMYALNATNGATVWTQALGATYSSPVVVAGIVYVATFAGTVYALSATTGAIVWQTSISSEIDSSPAVANGRVYIGTGEGTLAVLDAATGISLWSYKTSGFVESSPAVTGGVAYIGSDDGSVYAIKTAGPRTGMLLWSAKTGGVVVAAPVVANGKVFVGSQDGKMYAFDARSGTLQWSAVTGAVVRNAAVANGVVYAASDDDLLYAFAASSGAYLTTSVTGGSFLGGPAVSDGVVYFNAQSGNFSAFSLLAATDARPPARAPALATLHPDMSLAVTLPRNVVWADSDQE